MMGHTEPKLAGGLKMKAFYESPYGDDVVTNHMNHHVCGPLKCIMHSITSTKNTPLRKQCTVSITPPTCLYNVHWYSRTTEHRSTKYMCLKSVCA